jgi:hypothetical protein
MMEQMLIPLGKLYYERGGKNQGGKLGSEGGGRVGRVKSKQEAPSEDGDLLMPRCRESTFISLQYTETLPRDFDKLQ